jgi:lipoate-protein ligase A
VWMDSWVLARPVDLWSQLRATNGALYPYLLRVFETQRNCVVLARSNQASSEVNLQACQERGVPVLRRRGGGGTVVLGPGCQIVTLAFFARSLFDNARYFEQINAAWIRSLVASLGGGAPQIHQRGISDLAIGDRKIAGTSLFRRKHLVVFQGSLLVDPDMSLIGELLRHPSREPDYRQGRSHHDFVTSLRAQGVNTPTQDLCDRVRRHMPEHLADALATDLRAADSTPL